MTGFVSILPFAFCLFAFVQDGGTRQIIPEEFVKSRPAKSAGASARRASYRPAGSKSAARANNPKARPSDSPDKAQLGLTVWRLRSSRAADGGARIIVHHDNETEEWTPERIESNTPLRMGERIRFSFESPRAGYLYVIDREQYASGATGEPYLIFPTSRTHNGDNQVAPGHIIEIPGQEDRPNFFTLKQTRPDQTGELLTVIVTPQPIEGLAIGEKPLQLANEQVEQWEKQWSALTEKFEMTGGAGKAWTKAEQEAGANSTRQLTQDDPGPQTIYRVAVKPGAPLLVKVGLRYSRARPQTRK
ncbi:MAG: hypothetical protein JMDDDDMK_04017 [Acidobacteria bacterium]|nr:hypothetical protein [Acidobacteriota bacterium]